MKSREKLSCLIFSRGVSRREFLAAGLVTTAACLFPYKAVVEASRAVSPERVLSFYNTHTGENLKTVYWSDGTYVPQGLADVNAILRDHRTGEVKEIDTDLLDLLFNLKEKMGSAGPFHIISGYRSPETNAFLNMISKGVVKNSLHIQGKAIDIRLPGRELKTLQRAALDLRRGGVGYYPGSDFVHVDVGRFRFW
ncbi:MAG TPA: DUF882 domain-containing protein [Thermodesulfovibrionales bacterium]|jgi:uncharacterized protein YcbK (DUF882 family)|nr:DUF882 domain-containing protein [Thermodesulfovibrionales bacterium]